MKLLEFVRKHPSHAKSAICILAIGFAASFSALLVMGFAYNHVKTVAKNTNAALIAGDILAIREIQAAGVGEDAVHRALIDARVGFCLSHTDTLSLAEILTANDGRFAALCDALQTAAAKNSCTASTLSEALRQCASSEQSAARAEFVSTPGISDVQRRFMLYDTKKLAEEFFGVPFVFRTAGDVSYCKNLCGRFNEQTGRLTAFSAEWAADGDVRLSSEDCIDTARTFAEQRVGLKRIAEADAYFTDGVCWVSLSDARGSRWKIGVRADTGRVCFFCQSEMESAR